MDGIAKVQRQQQQQQQGQDRPSKPLLGSRDSGTGTLGLLCLLLDFSHRFTIGHLLIAVDAPQCRTRGHIVVGGRVVSSGLTLALALVVAGGRARLIVGTLVRLDTHAGGELEFFSSQETRLEGDVVNCRRKRRHGSKFATASMTLTAAWWHGGAYLITSTHNRSCVSPPALAFEGLGELKINKALIGQDPSAV